MGDALVTSIAECPAIEPGWGAVVTGTFRHEIGPQGVLRLLVEGASEAVGVTDNHPYWSEDRQDFVPAGELREGELLRTQLGPRRVVSITHDPNHIGFVYNLETTEHVYLVGALGALVHNTCQDGDGGTPRRVTPELLSQIRQPGERLAGQLDSLIRQRAGFAADGVPLIIDSNSMRRGMADALRDKGYNVRTVEEIFGKVDPGDPAIASLARTLGGKVLTFNMRDFGRNIGIEIDPRAKSVKSWSLLINRGLQ